jgi:hypothetical protein
MDLWMCGVDVVVSQAMRGLVAETRLECSGLGVVVVSRENVGCSCQRAMTSRMS